MQPTTELLRQGITVSFWWRLGYSKFCYPEQRGGDLWFCGLLDRGLALGPAIGAQLQGDVTVAGGGELEGARLSGPGVGKERGVFTAGAAISFNVHGLFPVIFQHEVVILEMKQKMI